MRTPRGHVGLTQWCQTSGPWATSGPRYNYIRPVSMPEPNLQHCRESMQAGAGLYFEMETMQPVTCKDRLGSYYYVKKGRGADNSGTGQVHREAGSLI